MTIANASEADARPEYARADPRVPVNITARIQFKFSEGLSKALSVDAIVSDLSATGAKILVSLLPDQVELLCGSLRSCQLYLPAELGLPGCVKGKPVWVVPGAHPHPGQGQTVKLGLQFEAPHDGTLDRLRHFVGTLASAVGYKR